MTPTVSLDSAILRKYASKTPTSAERQALAGQLFPSGITHDARYMRPHPIFVSHAAGSHKWDVDGNEYVDYFGGHGSLILGHCHPAVVEAVQRQVARGTHYGASHELELEWAGLVRDMVPCAERVRFTASGTEATLLGLRVARAYTGKTHFVRFAGHFHGWHDHVAFASSAGSLDYPSGVLPDIVNHVVVSPPNDIAALRQVLESRDDIAAVIVEPTGGSFGHVPQPGEFLAALRQLTKERRVVLIFDEVITGFRCSPGGAQQHYGVTPDLTTLAKILAGGYPGGALVGRADLLSVMDYKNSTPPAVPHQGTFNANPVSAAAGLATLKLVRSTDVTAEANRKAAELRAAMNEVIRRSGAPWSVYGDFSGFHIFTNPARHNIGAADIQAGKVDWRTLKGGLTLDLAHKIRAGFLCGGVDVCNWPGGWLSLAHQPADLDRMLSAFESLLGMLAEEGDLD